MSSFKASPLARRFTRRHRISALVMAVLLSLWAGGTGRYHCVMPGAKHKLLCAVNRHTGHAHMTRGMNTETIAALDGAATDADIPALQEILLGDDRVAAMTAAEVLKDRGKKGHDALVESFAAAKQAKDTARADLIHEYGALNP